ncbi:hypothetical protein CLU79DRAFT_734433 [Phycomyces nitens]|nr:hypothetical protein CLU79DRAFT_734433 [Phycomyces nitens]
MSFLRTIEKAWPIVRNASIRSNSASSSLGVRAPTVYRSPNILWHSFHTTSCVRSSATASPEIQTEDKPKPAILRPIPLKRVWDEYLRRIENDDQITEDYLILVCRYIKRDGGNDSIEKLQNVMREIRERSKVKLMDRAFLIGCNMLIHLYITDGDLKSARMIYNKMPDMKCRPDKVTMATMINGIAKIGTTQDLHAFYQLLLDDSTTEWGPEVYKRFIIAFGERGDVENSRKYFDLMRENSVEQEQSLYNVMLTMYENVKDHRSSLELLNDMIDRGVAPSEYTYSIILNTLKACEENEKMEEIYQNMVAKSSCLNTGHLITMGMTPEMALDELKRVNIRPSTRDYNTCIAIEVRQNRFDKALDMFKRMNIEGVQPDVFSYTIVIDAIVKDNTQEPMIAYELFEEMKSRGIHPDVVLYTSLISLYSRENDLSKVMNIFMDMKRSRVKPNLFTFNTIIGSLLNKKTVETKDINFADSLWEQMEANGISPDTRTYNMFITLLHRKIRPTRTRGDPYKLDDNRNNMPREMKSMLRMFGEMKRKRSRLTFPDFITYTVLVNSLVGCGQLKQAMLIYEEAKSRRLVLSLNAYNNLMDGLERSMNMPQVMTIWHYMKKNNVLPDEDSYAIVLEACRSLGLDDAFLNIRMQRKADFARLLKIGSPRETYENRSV